MREASGRSGAWSGRRPGSSAGRRGRGRQAAKIGVPAAVIVTVGAGALLMLTGRANEVLAERAATGPASPAATGFSASLSPVHTTLSGYPGEHGNVAVAAMWSATGLTVAVGAADGHPAVWRRDPDGDWSLVSAAVLGGLPGHLTSVAEGPLGWIAVGSVENGMAEPMAYQSADGMTWSPLPTLTALVGNDAQFLGVAAGPGGYLVVGRQGSGKDTSAALWHSNDLRGWTNGSSGKTGSLTVAAVSAGNGFVAVGSEMSCHTIWTSPDGNHWTAHDLAKPDGAQAATLTSVAVGAGGHIVAAGFATKNGSDLPIVVASADGGAQQTQIVLATSSGTGTGTVTAVTATSDGFVAVGLEGPASAQRAVTWTSTDGLTWSAASPLTAAGSNEVTALTDTSAATASPTAPSTSTSTSTSGSIATGPASSSTASSSTASSSTASPGTGSAVTGSVQDGASPTLLTVPAP